MKKFLINLIIFAALFFALDKLFILIRNRAPELEVDKRLEVLLQGKMDADVLIFGSSVGARGIIASTLSKELNCKAYNLSYPGSNIDFHEFILRQLLNNGNKKPSCILLTVDEPSALIANTSINFRLERLYPLVKYPQVRNELVERGEKNKFMNEIFILYQLNKSNLDLRKRNFTALDSILPCGSMPSYHVTNNFPSTYETKTVSYAIDKESPILLNKFISFVDLCAKNKIQLIIVYPPKYRLRNIAFEERIKSLTLNKAFHFMYDDSNSAYKTKLNFGDASHLTTNGALLFSIDVASFLSSNKLVKP